MEFEIRLVRRDDRSFTRDAIERHVAALRTLDEQGRLIAAGPLADGSGGVILARFGSQADAERYAAEDAYVVDGYRSAEVRPWVHAHRRNGYLLDSSERERVFVELPLDKDDWHPSPLAGQIVLVTTTDGEEIDVAPKSWVSMAAFAGPVVGFGCNRDHGTCRNVDRNREFVINVPDASLAERIWRLPETHGRERWELAGLTARPSRAVTPAAIAECVAHLECRHHTTVDFPGGEVFIFGTIVAASIDARCLDPELAIGYHRLDPIFFLENGLYATMGPPQPIALD